MMEALKEKKSLTVGRNKLFFLTLLPFSGLILGMLTGLFTQTLGSFEKELALYQFSTFQLLNEIKQVEIKHFALVIPLLPLFLKILCDLRQDKTTQGWKRLQEAFRKTLTLELFVYLAAVIAAMMIAAHTRPWFSTFNPSGHVLLKFQLAALTQKVLHTASKFVPFRALVFFSAIYSLSDAAFIHNTASYYHTAPELLASLGVGILLTWGASRLKKQRSSTLKGCVKSDDLY